MFLKTKDLFNMTGSGVSQLVSGNYMNPNFSSGRPFINMPQVSMTHYAVHALIADKKTIMNWVKRTPEALGILRAIAQDIITSIDFKSIVESKVGRPSQDTHKRAEDRARVFAKKHQLKQTLMAACMDWLMGDGYIWIGQDYEKATRKEIVIKKFRERGLQINESDADKFLEEEPISRDKQLEYVPATTMRIRINEEGTGIDRFRQETNMRVREWTPNQIIHFKFMELDGKVYGYSPMEAGIPILKTLGAITDYHGHFFDGGGTPDIIFNFPELSANDPALASYRQTIQEWADNKRRGHLVIGAKLEVERVNEMNKDMEFRLLAIYYTGRLAFSFGMPLEKFQAILGSEVKSSTGSSDLGNADYQRNISDSQDYWENQVNTQFWNPNFEVDMKLARGFLQDQVRKLQVDTQKVAVLEGMIRMGIIKKENVPDMINMHFPDIPRNWIETELPRDWVMGTGGQQMSNDKLMKGPASQGYAEAKRQQQKPQAVNSPPTGKEIKELFEINFDRFMDEMNKEKITSNNRNRVEMEDNGDTISFYLTPLGINKTYVSTIDKSNFSQFKRFMMQSVSKPAKRVN